MCVDCGTCRSVCTHPDGCIGCGDCVSACPRGCIRIAGRWWEARELADQLLQNADLLRLNGGGITFSGGECSLQTPFILAVKQHLGDLHCAIETCGYAPEETFKALISQMDLVMFDIKHTDPVIHKKYTGVDNALIRKNLQQLIESGVPFIARVPVIPGVNDSEENLTETARWVADAKNLITVELLPYNKAAGGKYKSVGMTYAPQFDENQTPNLQTDCFTRLGVPAKVM
jgi:pyruvate formate lyase activating enzyme